MSLSQPSLKNRCLWSLVMAGLLLVPLGCGSEPGPERKPTFKVHGKVTVDGKTPDSPIQVHCHLLSEPDPNQTTVTAAQTDNDGHFELSTYESGDGVPAGEYALTFEWKQLNLVSMSYGGPDKLNKRYNDPEKSEIRFTVKEPAEGEEAQPIDLGTIELTTK